MSGKKLQIKNGRCRDMLNRLVGRYHCSKNKHEWELIEDEIGQEFPPTRRCVFKCARCGERVEFNRWAFLHGAGALTYFFDKYWSYTKQPNDHNQSEQAND
jgi:hypothetical protein